ncbi:uncharacterized protein JCM15063_004851 [Sporobolomyces koalae]|uniref:uncharacterized protein n=1 Tax=Sporobolomyces koalae TaxID=500713 RepID=UPI003181BCCE
MADSTSHSDAVSTKSADDREAYRHEDVGRTGGVGETKRQLKPRHLQMIGFGGAIALFMRSLFIGSGLSLTKVGPIALFLAYCIIGTLLFAVMECLGELSTMYPGSGSFPHFAGRFIDPAAGFALGISYFYGNALGFANDLSAVCILVDYWPNKIPTAALISIFYAGALIVAFMPVRFFGEIEFVTAGLKVFAFIIIIIVGLVIDLGGAPTHDRLGFRYWRDSPWVQYNGIEGALGRFASVVAAFVGAAFTYLGTETMVLAAGESKNPLREIPRAIKKVAYRILFFYVGGIFLVTVLVPSSEPRLKGSGATASPFVIAIQNGGIRVLPHILNALFIVSAWSAGNSYAYTASRTLYSLALSGRMPKAFTKVLPNGVPFVSVAISMSFGCLAYLSISNGPAQVFSWLQNINAVSGLINWGCICLCWIRFNRARQLQGISRSSLPYIGRLMPYLAWYGLIASWIIALVSGFSVFLKGNWSVSNFFAAYVSLGWKLWHKTKLVPLAEMDLDSGRGAILADHEILSIEEEKRRADEMANFEVRNPWQRFLDWLL